MTHKTGFSVRDNLGIRREVEMEVGSSNGYATDWKSYALVEEEPVI